MDPIYTTANTRPAYLLNWGLTVFWRELPIPDREWLEELMAVTEPDGVRILKHRTTTGEASQFFVSTQPSVSPSQLIRSVKGRLQNIVGAKRPKALQRNYALRSIGAATRIVVEDYVAGQLDHHQMADPQIQQRMEKYQLIYPDVDLSQTITSAHGQYWYNLHLTIVNRERWNQISDRLLSGLVCMIESAAKKHRHRLSRLAVLTDHMHFTIGCPIDQSPDEIALGYLNNAAFVYGMKPVFQYGYYVGTIGEYDRGAIAE